MIRLRQTLSVLGLLAGPSVVCAQSGDLPLPPSTQATTEQTTGLEPAKGAAWDYLDAAPGAGEPAATPPGDLAADPPSAEEETEFVPNLNLYGFADFSYWQPLVSNRNAWRVFYPTTSSFAVGNINLYVASQMTKTLGSLLEVRFTYLPHGKNRSGLEPVGQPYIDTSTRDYTNAERPLKLGSIAIERVQLEYAPLAWLSVVVGQWLTPYGIWNVDHGSPTTLTSTKPYLVGEQYIPERQTGLLVQGSFRQGRHAFAYNAGLSNGRGPLDAYYDMDNNKAGTLHLSWQFSSGFGQLRLGVSGYAGRYTAATRAFGLKARKFNGKDTLQLVSFDRIVEQYDEYSMAADAQWTKGGFSVISEAIMNTRKYTRAGRPELQGSFLSLVDPQPYKLIQPDSRRWGAYVIAGYRFRWLGIMPSFQFEYNHLDVPDVPTGVSAFGGLNARPHESVTLKAHFGSVWFPGAHPGTPARDSVQALVSQIAWAF